MDILVEKKNIKRCESVLDKLLYREVLDEDRVLDEQPTSQRHQHINVRIKPNSPVVIEIHFTPAYGQTGRILTAERAWKDKQLVMYRQQQTAILAPTSRVFLNAAHALSPTREFLHGDIALRQLAEFVALVRDYQNEINWAEWYKMAVTNGLKTEFVCYLSLAHHLMEMPWPIAIPRMDKKGFHFYRILNKGGAFSRQKDHKKSMTDQYLRMASQMYFWLKLPGWVWRNTCYAPNLIDFPGRVYLLFKKLFSAKSRSKI